MNLAKILLGIVLIGFITIHWFTGILLYETNTLVLMFVWLILGLTGVKLIIDGLHEK